MAQCRIDNLSKVDAYIARQTGGAILNIESIIAISYGVLINKEYDNSEHIKKSFVKMHADLIEADYLTTRAEAIQYNPAHPGIEFIMDELLFDVMHSWTIVDGLNIVSDSLNAP
jgi:hypothetical protein